MDALSFLISEHDFLCIDYRCGLHLNLVTPITTNFEWKNFVKRYIGIEPALLPLISPARVFKYNRLSHTYDLHKSNRYCSPISFSKKAIENILAIDVEADFFNTEEYRAIEFKRVVSHGKQVNLLEIRLHNGTTSCLAVLSWLALWMKIVNRFESLGECDDQDIVAHCFYDLSDENAVDLIDKLDSIGVQNINHKLINEIRLRRKKMRTNWLAAFPDKVESWDSAGFYA